jgi:ribosome-associated toxin RatA of RatAB toxin-antitoxin module
MPVTLHTETKQSLNVNCSASHAFALLKNVKNTVALFPKLEQALALGDDTWRWELEEIQAMGFSHQVKYTVAYSNNGSNCISWKPVVGEGNAQVSGKWLISPTNEHMCQIDFETSGDFEMDVPPILKSMAEKMIHAKFEAKIIVFFERITELLENS